MKISKLGRGTIAVTTTLIAVGGIAAALELVSSSHVRSAIHTRNSGSSTGAQPAVRPATKAQQYSANPNQSSLDAAVEAAATRLDAAVIALPSDASFANDIGAMAFPLNLSQQELAQVLSHEQNAEAYAQQGSSGGSTGACTEAIDAAYHADQVATDAKQVEKASTIVESDLQNARAAVASAASASDLFNQTQAADSSYYPHQPAPTGAQLSADLAQANNIIAQTLDNANGYIDQANANLTSAGRAVARASQAGNCGNPSVSRQQLNHIS